MSGDVPVLHRNLAFSYRVYAPGKPGGDPLVLLHGSGVDETVLAPLARRIAPHSTLFAVRGRVIQDGGLRWFTRLSPTEFDQQSIIQEADAFARFLPLLAEAETIDAARLVWLGYSNGANLTSSIMLRHPGLMRRAALLRAMPVLHEEPPADLTGTSVLVIGGQTDLTYGPYALPLASLLARHGAAVESATVPSGHEFGEHDAVAVERWLAGSTPVA